MKLNDLFLRCYAQRGNDGLWEAFCLDLTLAAQGSTFEEARQVLHEQIQEYVIDALVGQDKEHVATLLPRKAPLRYWLKYYWIKAMCRINTVKSHAQNMLSNTRSFREHLPLQPVTNAG